MTLTCTPATSGTYLYSWFLGGSQVPAETSSTYTISAAATSDGGDYTCKVTDGQGLTSAASAAVTLTVTGWYSLCFPPYFTVARLGIGGNSGKKKNDLLLCLFVSAP